MLVVDLDGTLYRVNTFHFFLKFLVFYSVRKFKFHLLLVLSCIVMSRLFRFTTHAKMKYNILKAIEPYKLDYHEFLEGIKKYKRHIAELTEPEFNIKILATAAPSCYGNIIAKNEKFDICIGTEFPIKLYNADYENKGEVKKKNVLQYLLSIGNQHIDTLVTDHLDDLPLLNISINNIVYNPNQFMKEELNINAITYKLRI